MRCLYCGKELALLKRLTGGGEFCSESHKKSYQDEYNRIALTRLLQAQERASRNAVSQDKPAPPAVTVAVEDPVEEPLVEEAVVEEAIEAQPLEEKTEAQPEEVYEEPRELAGFLLEQPTLSAPPEATPYVEPQLEGAPRPAAPTWLFINHPLSELPSAELLPTEARPQVRDRERTVQEVNLTPNEFAASEKPPLPFSMVPSNVLKSAGPIALSIAPQVINFRAQGPVETQNGFSGEPEYRGSVLLSVFPSTIDFPAEDAEVAVISSSIRTVEVEPADAVAEPPSDNLPASEPIEVETESQVSVAESTPGPALEALAKVHQEPPREEAETATVAETAVIQAEPEAVATPVEEKSAVAEVAEAPQEEAPKEEAPQEEAHEEGQMSPRASTDFIEFTVRNFAPPKPLPIDAGTANREKPALLPRLTGLPLRPKVALAPNQSVATPKAAPTKSPSPAAKETVHGNGQGPSRENNGKQPAKQTPASPAAAATPAAHSKPATPPAAARSAKPAGPAQPARPAAPAAKAAQPAAPSAKAAPVAEAAAKNPPAKAPETVFKPPVHKESQPPVEAAAPVRESEAPTFGSMQTGSNSAWGSLKLKLGIAIVLLVVACTAYLGWGTKSSKPPVAAVAADAPGPSIMVGEGGWVEGWAGDPIGSHVGRQISIYRPSLKLSDYRMEFQGQIDVNSIGWVFRAADPENYYAMKLTQVSGGLSPKLALFKYLIANGRQTQVGRVPIDLVAGLDMMLKVRLDVRGPRFSTYVQGQQVDVWTDDQLKVGGVGFLNEREERGRIKSVSIFYLNGNK